MYDKLGSQRQKIKKYNLRQRTCFAIYKTRTYKTRKKLISKSLKNDSYMNKNNEKKEKKNTHFGGTNNIV